MDLIIISLEGYNSSYAHFLIYEKDLKKVVGIVNKEKEENDEYSVDSVFDRLSNENIYVLNPEYHEIDFGM